MTKEANCGKILQDEILPRLGLPKSKIYLKSRHRLGHSPRVKIENENLKLQGCWNWQTSRPQTPVFLTCGFKSRPLHQSAVPTAKRRWLCCRSFLYRTRWHSFVINIRIKIGSEKRFSEPFSLPTAMQILRADD